LTDTGNVHPASPRTGSLALTCLREHGLVTFSGITSRTELASVAGRLMSIRPHRDAGPDGGRDDDYRHRKADSLPVMF
jgi:hypothetical protein